MTCSLMFVEIGRFSSCH